MTESNENLAIEIAAKVTEVLRQRDRAVRVTAAIEHIIATYFEPHGAGKMARWESLTNDAVFSAESALHVIRRELRGE